MAAGILLVMAGLFVLLQTTSANGGLVKAIGLP